MGTPPAFVEFFKSLAFIHVGFFQPQGAAAVLDRANRCDCNGAAFEPRLQLGNAEPGETAAALSEAHVAR